VLNFDNSTVKHTLQNTQKGRLLLRGRERRGRQEGRSGEGRGRKGRDAC